jgi:hypothetical protein
MLWELHLHRDVIAYLVSLREAGHDVRAAIYSLQKAGPQGVPEGDVTELEQDSYMWVAAGHKIGYRIIDRDKKRIFVAEVEPINEAPETDEE